METKMYIGVSKNRGTPKSSILIGFSIINHPFWGTPIFGNTHIIIRWGFFTCIFSSACHTSRSGGTTASTPLGETSTSLARARNVCQGTSGTCTVYIPRSRTCTTMVFIMFNLGILGDNLPIKTHEPQGLIYAYIGISHRGTLVLGGSSQLVSG